jgi:hypothetical protein
VWSCKLRFRNPWAGTTGSTARALAKGMAGDPLLQRARGGPERKALQSTTRSRRRRARGTYAAHGTAPIANPLFFCFLPSGAEGDRTPDLRIANAALSQLSYGPWDGHKLWSGENGPGG